MDKKRALPEGAEVVYQPVKRNEDGEIAYRKTDTLTLEREKELKKMDSEPSQGEEEEKPESIKPKKSSFYDSRIERERSSRFLDKSLVDPPSNVVKPVLAEYESLVIDRDSVDTKGQQPKEKIEILNIEPESIDIQSDNIFNVNVPRYPESEYSIERLPSEPRNTKMPSQILKKSDDKPPVLTVETISNPVVYHPPVIQKPEIKKSVKIIDPKETERSKTTELTDMTETDISFLGFDDENLFKLKLQKSDNLDDLLTVYDNQVEKKKNMLGHEEDIDKYYDILFDEVANRGLLYDDGYFPAGPSSMVNNTRKTKMPYARLDWKKLTEIYEVKFYLITIF